MYAMCHLWYIVYKEAPVIIRKTENKKQGSYALRLIH